MKKMIKFTQTVYSRGIPEYKVGDQVDLSEATQRFVRRGQAEVVEVAAADDKKADKKVR